MLPGESTPRGTRLMTLATNRIGMVQTIREKKDAIDVYEPWKPPDIRKGGQPEKAAKRHCTRKRGKSPEGSATIVRRG